MDFEPQKKLLNKELLLIINSKEMALPDFQRDFVWAPSDIKDLIISIMRGFPAGSILRIDSRNETFKPREFKGAPSLDGHTPRYLVLDGQQRLTSLYQAFYGTGDYEYFLRLNKLMSGADLEEALEYHPRGKRYKTLADQAYYDGFPLSSIFTDTYGGWLRRALREIRNFEAKKQKSALLSSDEEALYSIENQYITPITEYNFPVITLNDNENGDKTVFLEAVCKIFETLNSTGVRLSVFDLLTARFFVQDVNLRELWENATNEYNTLELFDVDPYYILQSISLSVHKSPNRKDVLRLTTNDIHKHWNKAIVGMDNAVQFLRDECGVVQAKYLSYRTMLIPLAAFFAEYAHLKGADKGNLRKKLSLWYWCSVFDQTYEKPTPQTVKDFDEFKKWFDNQIVMSSVDEFQFDKKDLLSATVRQRSIYYGVICLLLHTRPKDFHSAQTINADLMRRNGIDDHHIFPRAFLKEKYPDLDERSIDAIVNRTLIDSETNRRIGKQAPSEYLKAIEKAWQNSAQLQDVLTSHLLSFEIESSLYNNDFEMFRQERADNIYNLILSVTSIQS
jgi:hypothetical protein